MIFNSLGHIPIGIAWRSITGKYLMVSMSTMERVKNIPHANTKSQNLYKLSLGQEYEVGEVRKVIETMWIEEEPRTDDKI